MFSYWGLRGDGKMSRSKEKYFNEIIFRVKFYCRVMGWRKMNEERWGRGVNIDYRKYREKFITHSSFVVPIYFTVELD